ncbi:MAG: transcriptional regulator with GAF, ATPase, and Fis domain [Myxococcota bacterium]|jgi:transcriptional regulator with GAF, ATPase, and Fis domain
MPQLILQPRGNGKRQIFPLFKKITTIGKSAENDVMLDMPGIGSTHAHVLYDGKHFVLSESDRHCEVLVNGRRRKSHKLADNDSIRIGPAQLSFSLFDEIVDDDEPATTTAANQALEAMEKLEAFSEKLSGIDDIEPLLNAFMDDIIELSRADKGFLILLDGETPVVRVARNLDQKTLEANEVAFSDSIVQKVLMSKRPIIVSDALHDREFSGSTSIINLRLCSVMSAPLLTRGNLLGLIYVGNDNIVNLFRPYQLDTLRVFASQAALIINNALLVNDLTLERDRLEKDLADLHYGEIIGSCDSMRAIYSKVDKLAATDISVLITGETGTGKELIAKEIHKRSNRAKGTFITLNCGAIPENLLESELFGHVRGSFTGAIATQIGKFEAADGGTLFLDELGEMPASLQVKLLRAIQERQIVRVGETRTREVDIRILAATNKDLAREVKEGNFREDLFYRLNVVNLHLPPLRDRGDDVVVIANYLLKRYAKEFKSKVKGFAADATRQIKRYEWPGNIRELENRIKKSIVFTDGALIRSESMDFEGDEFKTVLPLADAKEAFQKDYIDEVLRLNAGNRTKSARDLDVDPRTIFRHLEKYGDPNADA